MMNSSISKGLLTGAVTLAMTTAAQADPIFFDVGVESGGTNPPDANTLTDVFNQLQFFADTTTTQFDDDGTVGLSVGDSFSDDGSAHVTALLPSLGTDTEGLNSLYEFTFEWSGLTGTVVDIDTSGTKASIGTSYDAGSLLNFYLDGSPDANFGGLGAGDNTGFGDGTAAFTIEIKSGTGSNTFTDATFSNFETGSANLVGEVVAATSDIMYIDNGDGIADTTTDFDWADLLLGQEVIISHIDQNTDNVATVVPGSNGGLFDVMSDHDGSVDFDVPEPSTLALLGGSLIGLAGVKRRRQRRA